MNGKFPLVACWFILIILSFVPFIGALNNQMIGDDSLIMDHRLQLQSAADLLPLLTQNYWGDLESHTRLYRPVTLVALGTEKLLFGGKLWPFRVTSLFLHACCVLIVFELVWLMVAAGSRWPAWCAASVFAVHPIHAEAVITLYGQADLWAAVFGLAAVLLYVRFSDHSKLGLVLSLLCYTLSLGSKESGALIPCVAILLRYLRTGVPIGLRTWIAHLRWVDCIWLLAFGAYLVARLCVLGADLIPSGEGSVAMGYPVIVRMQLLLVTVGEYVRMLFLPWSQVIYYGHLRDAIFGVPWWHCVIFIVSFLGLRELYTADRRTCLLVAATFALLLFPVSNLIPIGIVVAERAIYLPSVALPFLVAWAIVRATQSAVFPTKQKWAVAAFVAVLLSCTAASWKTAHHWRNPLSLWRYTANCHPRSPKAQAFAAIHVLNEVTNAATKSADAVELLGEARQRLQIARQLNPHARLTLQGMELLAHVERSFAVDNTFEEHPSPPHLPSP